MVSLPSITPPTIVPGAPNTMQSTPSTRNHAPMPLRLHRTARYPHRGHHPTTAGIHATVIHQSLADDQPPPFVQPRWPPGPHTAASDDVNPYNGHPGTGGTADRPESSPWKRRNG